MKIKQLNSYPNAWYLKNLGDAMLADEKLDIIKRQFIDIYGKFGNPVGLAIFMKHESEGRLHCEVKVYFPPATYKLVQEIGAVVCNKPTQPGLSLLVGSEESLLKYFQELSG